MNARTSKACSTMRRNSSAFARTKSGSSAFADKSKAMAARSRTASALEFRPLGADDAFEDVFKPFILIHTFQLIPRFQFEQTLIFIQPLAFNFLLELQNPTAAFSTPVRIRQDAGRLVRIIVGRRFPLPLR